MKTIRWGIIGCGDVCEVKSGPAFYTCEHSALQAVMRRDAGKAADFAKRHRVPGYYTDADRLIHDPAVDVVYVATPPGSHAEWAIRALQAGKPVYVEKPMGRNYAECLRMNQAAKESHQKLWVAYYRRSLPYFLKVKELLDDHAIGKIQMVRADFFRPPLPCDTDEHLHTWRVDKDIAGGGYFYDMAPHTIDILMFLLGNIAEANGIAGNVGHLYRVEDTVSASFLFESGVVGSAIWCYVSSASVQKDRIEIIGEKGKICFSTFDFAAIEWITGEKTEEFYFPRPEHIQQPMIQCIVDEMLGTGQCPSDGESGSRVNWVMDRLFGEHEK
ncbi:MAG: Gfo/Idh/MocA family oxidoreductase [Tannerella sp.]|jgi:predicted dehydrogenase|nr:Gfo/Idh/MocA family oxidoreductase [Tannerella sp.]